MHIEPIIFFVISDTSLQSKLRPILDLLLTHLCTYLSILLGDSTQLAEPDIHISGGDVPTSLVPADAATLAAILTHAGESLHLVSFAFAGRHIPSLATLTFSHCKCKILSLRLF